MTAKVYFFVFLVVSSLTINIIQAFSLSQAKRDSPSVCSSETGSVEKVSEVYQVENFHSLRDYSRENRIILEGINKSISAIKDELSAIEKIRPDHRPLEVEQVVMSSDEALTEEQEDQMLSLFERLEMGGISQSSFSEEFSNLQAAIPEEAHYYLMLRYSKAINDGLVMPNS